jgi:PGF-CTERM protein
MSPPTNRLVVVAVVAALLVVSVGPAAPSTAAPEDYTLSIDGSIDIPDRTVTVEGSEYDVQAFGRVSPGDTIEVDVSAPAGREYRVNLYNWKIQTEDTDAMTGSGTAVLETDGVPPGTYFVAVVEDGYQKIFPVVIEGYDLTLSTTDTVERGSAADVSLSLTPEASTGEPNAVQVVVGNESTAMRVEATRTGSGSYEASVPTDSLSPGTYALYGVVRGDAETDSGDKVTLAVTDKEDVRVTEATTATATPADDDDGSSDGGGGGGGAPPATATATATATPGGTATPSASPTATPSGPASPTPTTTATASMTTTATAGAGTASPTASSTTTASPTPTVTETGPVTPRQTTSQPSTTATSGDGTGFGPAAALLALLAATLLLARRR